MLTILSLLTGATLTAPADTGLTVRAVRFYRAEVRQTQVTAFIQVAGQEGRTIGVRVADAAGETLWEQSWQVAPAGGVSVDHLRFTVGPGGYTLGVSVRDSTGRLLESARLPVEGYPSSPAASDLLVSPLIRPVDHADTVPRAQEFRRGSLLITAAAVARLRADEPTLHYLLEAYAPAGGQGMLAVLVRGPTGAVIREAAPAPIRVPAGVGVLTGQLELATLAPGAYTLQTILTLGEQRIERSAAFEMAGEPEVIRSTDGEEERSDEAFFAALPPAELAAALAPLELIAGTSGPDPRTAPAEPEALRRWLVEFWRGRNPGTVGAGNVARDLFYRSVRYADEWYREPARRGVPGWRTDRGRVLLRNGGPPDQVLRRQGRGTSPAYEAWRYREGEGYFYVFADRSGLGGFLLVHSNDLREPGQRNWRELLGDQAVIEIEDFLGIRF